MNNIIIGNNYNIKGEGYNMKIYLINDKNENDTYIDLLNCEEKLREVYKLKENNLLTILQVEIDSNDENTLTNIVKYGIFDENKIRLNLSICENIKVNYKINNISSLNLTKLTYYSNKGIDILNIEDPFFNDICFIYSENDLDIILKDRIKYIYQNYSICDSDCKYEKINIEKMTISCICSSSSNIELENKNPIFKQKIPQILNYFQDSTGVIKYYNFVFRAKNKIINIGFWIFLISFINHIILYLTYFKSGINPIKEYVEGEMEKYHYQVYEKDKIETDNEIIKENNENNSNCSQKKNFINSERIIIDNNKISTSKTVIPRDKNDNNLIIIENNENNIEEHHKEIKDSNNGPENNNNIISYKKSLNNLFR